VNPIPFKHLLVVNLGPVEGNRCYAEEKTRAFFDAHLAETPPEPTTK
jgi:hypothetical protein